MSKLAWLWLGIALLAGSCAEDTEQATALVVSVKSDLTELTGLRVRTYPSNVNLVLDAERPASEATIAMADLNKPIVINQGTADELLLVVRGLGVAGAQIIEHAIRVRFSEGKSIAVPVYLGRSCLGVACPSAGETCYAQPTGNTSCGRCVPIALLDEQREIMSAGEEASWVPRLCFDGGPLPTPVSDSGPAVNLPDAGPTDTGPTPNIPDAGPDADAGDAGDGSVSCAVPAGWISKCTLAPLCGCEPRQGCNLDIPVLDNNNPKFSCAARSVAGVGAECTKSADCSPGLSCLTLGGSYAACFEDCAAKADCAESEACSPAYYNDTAIVGVGNCRQSCETDADCPEKCCGENKRCAPKSYCETRDLADCEVSTDCVGTSSRKGGLCLMSVYEDGGTSTGSCFSKCTVPSDCVSGCCRNNVGPGLSFCLTVTTGLTADQRAMFCTAQ